MIMPVSAVSNQTKPMFKGTIKNSAMLNDTVDHFTRMERLRWDKAKASIEKPDNNCIFEIYDRITKIGKTIFKSVVVKENSSGELSEEVYDIKRGGSVLLFSREILARTILDALENKINPD